MKRLVILLISLLMPASLCAETLYICHGGNGTDPTAGVCSTAWNEADFNTAANWGDGANKISAGDTVNLMSVGGNLSQLVPQGSGASGNVVTIQNRAGDNTVISVNAGIGIRFSRDITADYITIRKNPSGGSLKCDQTGGMPEATAACITIDSRNNITIDGLIIEGTDQPDKTGGIWIAGSSSFVTIKNSVIKDFKVGIRVLAPNQHDILIEGNTVSSNTVDGIAQPTSVNPECTQIVVRNNTSEYNGRQGILLSGCERMIVEGNILRNNNKTGIQIEAVRTTNPITGYVVVRDNYCENNNLDANTERCIWIDGTRHALVERNRSAGGIIGYGISDSEHVIFRNNITYQNNRMRPPRYGHPGATQNRAYRLNQGNRQTMGLTPGRHYAYHNLSHDDGIGAGTGSTSPRRQTCLATQEDGIDFSSTQFVKNNVIYDCRSAYEVQVHAGRTSATFRYNYYYNSRRPLKFEWSGKDNTASEWEALTSSTEIASRGRNPLFRNPGAHDYTLQDSSPLIGAAGELTTVSSTGAGTITVADSYYFYDGWGIRGETGDRIAVFSSGWSLRGTATIRSINYSTHVLTVNSVPAGTVAGDFVMFGKDYAKKVLVNRPDIGPYWR